MQLGHLPLALSIATYRWSPETAAFCLAMHWLPNADTLVERSGLAKPGFHCTVTHTVAFAVIVSGVVSIFAPQLAILALVAILAHFAADLGSTVGLPLLMPFTRKKFTLALFKDTGSWGKSMLVGYYRQPIVWVLEGGVFAFLFYRLVHIGVIG